MSSPLATGGPKDGDGDDDDDDFDPTGEGDADPRTGIVVVHNNGQSDDTDDEEATGLMSRAEPMTKDEFSIMSMDYEVDEERVCSGSFRILVTSMVGILVVALLAVLLPGIRNKSNTLEVLRTPVRIPVEYDCRDSEAFHAENYDPDMRDQYISVSESITDNMTEFLDTFRESNFDDWGKSYEEVKGGMYHFKSSYFPPYLQDGSTIYESACGIGLNLYMTLEILKETHGIENLFVYGNELWEVSAGKANAVFDQIAPARAKKGLICPADSSQLGFVPANSFDLVYTGYISPLLDPLNFALGTPSNYDRYTALCKSDPTEDWAKYSLNKIAQERQNDWYGEWVAQMARIAKPGVPVIVEQVSPAYCDAFFDWGGVHRDWWFAAASNNTYGWHVDPSSLVIVDDSIFRERYHVFMLKNGKRESP